MYGYNNPYPYGGYPTMQNRLANLEQNYQQQYNRPQVQNNFSVLSGRLVTGIDEAKASQIPLDGTISYFPAPSENKIYTKSLDMNGLPVFLTYELKMQNSTNLIPQTEEKSQFDVLNSRISALENKLKEIQRNDEPNANSSNAQYESKSSNAFKPNGSTKPSNETGYGHGAR